MSGGVSQDSKGGGKPIGLHLTAVMYLEELSKLVMWERG